MRKLHALEINRTTKTILLDGSPISVVGDIVPRLDLGDGEDGLTAFLTIPLSSITVKTPSGSVRVDAPEAGE